MAVAFYNINVIFLMRDPDHFAIESLDEVQQKNSMFLFWQLVTVVILQLFMGLLYDLTGRRTIIIACFGTMTIALVTVCASSSYIMLGINRVFLGIAGHFLIANPLIPDYVKKNSRGKTFVITMIGSGVGEIVAM